MVSIGGTEYENWQIRNWAARNGWPDIRGARGRIPKAAMEAFTYHFQEEHNKKVAARREAEKKKTEKAVAQIEPPRKRVVSNKVEPRKLKGKVVRKPSCPLHNAEMVHSALLNMWACPEKDCKQRAWPKDVESRPVVGSGKLSAVRENDRLYLRSGNGVLIDITDNAIDVEVLVEDSYPTAEISLAVNFER